MRSRKYLFTGEVQPVTYSFGEHSEHYTDEQSLALLALSHTPVEQQLYQAMRAETAAIGTRIGAFSPRRLMSLTGIKGYSTIRRGLAGLLNKMSVERQKVAGDGHPQSSRIVYLVFSPQEILARRQMMGLAPYPKELQFTENQKAFGLALESIIGRNNLSRREAQVALCCAEGLSNAQIAVKLGVSEQTVKFHLRHIFVKFGVKRRAELVSRLLTQGGEQANGRH